MEKQTCVLASLQAEIPESLHTVVTFQLARGFMRPPGASKPLSRPQSEGAHSAFGKALHSASHKVQNGYNTCGGSYLNKLTWGGSFDSLWLVCGEQETQKTLCVLKRGHGGSVNTEANESGVQTEVVENQDIVILLYSFECFRKTLQVK